MWANSSISLNWFLKGSQHDVFVLENSFSHARWLPLNRFVCISCHKQRSNQLEDLSKHFQTLTGFTLPEFHEIARTEISDSNGHYSFGQLIVHLQWGWNSPDETDRKTYYWAIKIRYRYGSWGTSAWCLKGVVVESITPHLYNTSCIEPPVSPLWCYISSSSWLDRPEA